MENEVIKVLFLASNLPDLPKEDFVTEYNKLQERLQFEQSKFKTVQKFALTIDILQDAILTEKPNIIHFSGHGSISGELTIEEGYRSFLMNDNRGIVVMDDTGKPKIIKTKAIANCFNPDYANKF